jgi:hypothetical protein
MEMTVINGQKENDHLMLDNYECLWDTSPVGPVYAYLEIPDLGETMEVYERTLYRRKFELYVMAWAIDACEWNTHSSRCVNTVRYPAPVEKTMSPQEECER